MKKMAVRKYYGHFWKPTREVSYTKTQEFINRTRQVKIIAVNIIFCEEEQKVGLFVYHLEGLRVPLLVRVPQFGKDCFRIILFSLFCLMGLFRSFYHYKFRK